MKKVIKIVILGLILFSVIVFLTLPNQSSIKKEEIALNYRYLPSFFDVVNASSYTKRDDFFDKFPTYVLILNHDSLAVFKDLYKKNIDEKIVLVANISNTPWLIKQIAVNGELEKMYKTSKIPLINDSNGAFINSLNLNNNSQNSYYLYRVDEDGNISFILDGNIKKGALQDGISEDEINKELDTFLRKFKSSVNL